MRVQKSIKNIISALSSNILTSILAFISRTVFIYTLGETYLGVSGLLQNVFGLLSITELGLSTAIGFSLYKPIANRDSKLISTLMSLYKKAYRIIGIVILIIGVILFKYLDFFVKPEQQPPDMVYIYFMYLINIVVSYFLSYKTTLIASDQNSFKLVPLQIKINVSTTILQILFLLVFKNYIGYLFLQISTSILLNFLQNRFITKEYKHINFSSKDKLPKEETKIIKKNIVGLMAGKIGDFCVNSTDNLIISKFINLVSVGIYGNYITLRNIVNGYIGILFGAITSGFGNLVASESKEKSLEIFDILFFVSFVLYSFEAVCFICLFNLFIKLWIGEKYLFSLPIVAVIVLNNYLTGLRMPIITMKSAAGVYVEDIWVPFGFSIVNLVSSIILAKYLGVFGVILGSIIGSLCTADWYRPIVIFKKVFEKPVIYYFKKYILYIFLGIAYMSISYVVCENISVSNIIINFVIRVCICVLIPNMSTIILFHRSKEYKYLYNIMIDCIRKKRKRDIRESLNG